MTVRFDHRQGQTLKLTFSVAERGEPVDVSPWTISCRLADQWKTFTYQVPAPQITKTPNGFTINVAASVTTAWPSGLVHGQLTIVDGADTLKSQTFELNILPSI